MESFLETYGSESKWQQTEGRLLTKEETEEEV